MAAIVKEKRIEFRVPDEAKKTIEEAARLSNISVSSYILSVVLKQARLDLEQNEIVTLSNLGASNHQIIRIFLFEGRLISMMGAVIGIVLGLLLCWIQQQYGIVRLGDSEGIFVVDAYPVSVHPWDVVVIFITVVAVGFLSVWYPVRYFARRLLRSK